MRAIACWLTLGLRQDAQLRHTLSKLGFMQPFPLDLDQLAPHAFGTGHESDASRP